MDDKDTVGAEILGGSESSECVRDPDVLGREFALLTVGVFRNTLPHLSAETYATVLKAIAKELLKEAALLPSGRIWRSN